MRRLLLTLCALLACAPLLRGAAYAPAAAALIDWTPNTSNGVGVPGGIPARATIYTTITTTGDSTDRAAEIGAALLACPSGQTVLLGPGTFYFSGLSLTHGAGGYYQIGNRTLRGSGSDPATGTVLRITGAASLGFQGSTEYDSSFYGTVSGSPVKGDTSLTLVTTGGGPLVEIPVGAILHLKTQDDDSLPVLNVNGYPYNKKQLTRVNAVNAGTGVVTFQPPLYQTPAKRTGGALSMTWATQSGLFATVQNAGIEDLVIDNTYGSSLYGISGGGMWACWIKNVRIRGALNYGMYFGESSQIEIRGCTIEASREESWVQSNRGGLGLSAVSASLIEDNIIEKFFPLIKMEGNACAGNVFAYNFLYQHANVYVLGNHNAGNHCNLWEGNCASGIATDGYFGSAADDVIYRNDLHGIIKTSIYTHFPVQLSRFTRRFEVVGNQLGRPGTLLNIFHGWPTAFNGTTDGVADNFSGDPHVDTLLIGTLTTRTSDTEGIITFPTTIGHLQNDGVSHLGLRWGTGYVTGRYNAGNIGVNAGALTLQFNQSIGGGTALPAEGTTIKVSTGPNGYKELDNGTDTSMVKLGNYYYSDSAIPAGQSLGSTTLPASLFRSTAPAFMSGYNWPPYDPVALDTRFSAIPAGARYEGITGAPTHTPGKLRTRRRR